MRTIIWGKTVVPSLLSLVFILPGHAPAQNVQATSAQATVSDVVARGQHFKVMERVRQSTNSTGEVTTKTNHYTVIANGLNFQDTNGNWIESHPVVQSYAGGIACVSASYSVILATNLNTAGAVDLETSDGQRLISNPLGLGFYDPDTGKSVVLAQVKDCGAVISSNHILYPDAFTGLKASVEYVYDIGHFHQNITLLTTPTAQPSDYGMGSRTRLEMLSELLQGPTPVTTTHVLSSVTDPTQRAAMASPDVVDQTLKFGSMSMGLGRAYPVGGQTTNQPGMTVPKQLLNQSGRNILIESVPWATASAMLSKPQQSASLSPGSKPGLTRDLPAARTAQTGTNFTARLAQVTKSSPVKLASNPMTFPQFPLPVRRGEGLVSTLNPQLSTINRPKGFTLDYDLVETCTDFDFYEGGTFLVAGDLSLDGTTIIDDTVVLKYTDFAKLTISGTIVNPGYTPLISALVLTSQENDSVGDIIDGSSGNPTFDLSGAPDLDLEYLDNDEQFAELDFSYCYGGLFVDNSPGRTLYVGTATYTNGGGNSIGSVYMVHFTSISVCNIVGMTTSNEYSGANITIGSFIDCHDANGNGIPDDWEMANFGALVSGTADYDGDGVDNYHEWLNGTDPNKIFFAINVTNQYVTTNSVGLNLAVMGGVPSSIAVLVDNTNTAGATWTNYTSSNITVSVGSTQGQHDVRVGLRGLQTSSQQTWEDTTLILDSAGSAITITNPATNISFNSSRVDVSGNFSSASVNHIFVNGIVAFVNGTNFEALNVPLAPGTNTVTASLVDFIGNTNSASITITALTNSDGSLNDPVQLQVGPVAGFYPLSVGFSATNNAPGTLLNVYYDFNGDDVADFTTNNLASFTNVYVTNGQFFPVVTLQTSSGRFSSAGGWDFGSLQSASNWAQINVQAPPTQVSVISITDPVDIKWTVSSNLYVLSGSSATITEFDSSTNSIRSLSGIGSSPSGLDVDAAGNVYVAMNGSNQVWRFKPTTNSFTVDTNFGSGGFIGLAGGATGTNSGEFNAPFDVAVSPDGSKISVSDSGNGRIQDFDTNGVFMDLFGGPGTNSGQFNTPKGLTYDSDGTLFIVDSGNSRIVLAQGPFVVEVTGTNGTGLGQFDGPVNLGTGSRGVYVGDAGNNRVQVFSPSEPHDLFNINPSAIRFAISTNLNSPAAVAAVENLTNELFYAADTGNDRVILYSVAVEDPTPVWTNMTSLAAAGNIPGAVACFSIASADNYRQAFLLIGTTNSISLVNEIGTLKLVFINNDQAEYYFTNTIEGQSITFPVEFNKENGQWKIMSF